MLQILSSVLSLILYLPFINADTKDTCGNVVASLPTGPNTFGTFAGCLCEDGLADAIATNPTLHAFAAFKGQAKAERRLDNLITSSSSERVCHYPNNAIPQCTIRDVCAFTCASGTNLCHNGKCHKHCPSAAPVRRDQLPMATPAPRCPAKQEMCRFGQSFKCVDTQSSLVSCGGCMHGKASTRGQDCSEIPGVDVVSCNQGVCDVQSCTKDYTFNPDYRNCSLTANDISS